MTEPAAGETGPKVGAHQDGADDEEAPLVTQVSEWIPPWQRLARTDTPTDEPVSHADVAPDGVAVPLDEKSSAPSQSSGEESADTAAAASVEDDSEPDPLPYTEDLAGTLEAILMVCEEPVSEAVLAKNLGRNETEVVDTLRRLSAEYTGDGRGFDLRRQAGGWRYYTRESFASHVERFVLDGQQVRLTKAALETLAVVAYRQPVTRGRISAIRGVNSDGVIRTLTTRGLIEDCGAEPESGAHLYRTTAMFLDKLGVNSVDELPPLAPFLPDNVDEIGDADDG